MNKKQLEVDNFIRLIRGISPTWLRYACTHGACHRFYLILKDRFPSAKPYHTTCDGGGHVVSKIAGMYWDIWGEHDPKRDGPVAPYKDRPTLHQMSSCHFDETFAILNTHIIMDSDRRKPSQPE